MQSRGQQDRRYTRVVIAFLVGLVVLGLLGVPALLVAAIGGVTAALAIALFRDFFETDPRHGPRRGVRRQTVPQKYVPSVLEGSSAQRRRFVHIRRHRPASPPLRLR